MLTIPCILKSNAAYGLSPVGAQIHKMERRDSSMTSRTYNLNPVVVTGSGHHQRLKSTATPVRVLSSQEIGEQGITTFDAVLTRMMPQASMAPNSMGTFLRLNGLGNKYILILINGQKLSGDISNNVDLNRINMSRVKRIEVLDGAASSLYGSDAIAGVINIITDRPETRSDVTGGTDYEMRYKGLRWNVGGIYKFTAKNSLQADFTVDRFRYGKEYDVETKTYAVGDYVQSKKQRTMDGELKAILGLMDNSTTIFGADWRKDYLTATSGSISEYVYTLAAYAQHEQRVVKNVTATVGLRLTHHETFDQHLAPKATLMYAPGNFRLRATYSAGFRAPGLDELYYRYYSVNRGKPQIIFGNRNLKPEKSNYVALNAEYRTHEIAVSVTGYLNRINDMVVRQNIAVDDASMQMLRQEFTEMTDAEAAKLERYSLYQNSDKGDVKGMQVNVSANVFEGCNLSANYVYTYARTKSGEEWTVLERSIRHAATIAANYHHRWGKYALNVNVNGRLQSKTYYPDYEDAPGYGVWNLHTTHSFDCTKWAFVEPSIGVDNVFDKVDRRIDSSLRKYALYSPGRMLVVGLKVRFKQ